MDKQKILDITAEFSESSPTNYLSPVAEDQASLEKLGERFTANNFNKHNMPQGGDYSSLNKDKTDEYIGMRFFKAPIMAVCRADDPGFAQLKKPGVIGGHFLAPEEWLPGAKSVISLFLPFTDRVINSNTLDKIQPSWEWLFTRVDGQQHLLATGELVRSALTAEGYRAVVPQTDDRYIMRTAREQEDLNIPVWSSNWSERHVGYVAGLGTFGKMTNLITKKGCCGRLISIVTDWETEPTVKDYTGLYDYCADCGACYSTCPGGAIGNCGKNIAACSDFLRKNCVQYAPRYGCGKCQSGLPCSTRCFKKA